MNARIFLCITSALLFHPQFCQQASAQELPSAPVPMASQPADDVNPQQQRAIPEAVLVPQLPAGDTVRMEADQQSKDQNTIRLTGNVVVRYLDYVIRSEELVYDEGTGVAISAGRVQVDGGPDQEHITAQHADLNLKLQSAHFFGVAGAIEAPQPKQRPENLLTQFAVSRDTLQSNGPFLFTAKEAIKAGPGHYLLIRGVVTSCQLPHPDWSFHSQRTQVDDERARMYSTWFRVLGVPVFYFPYATHSVNAEGRQSGFLIPIVGLSSTKGLIVGEQFYWAINRSVDLTLGLDYYSIRGYAPNGVLRYKGRGLDFAQFRFTALKDRGQPGTGIDQGGADIVFNGRQDFNPTMRVVGNLEYLNSYIYRQAFAESFNQAVASQVKSDAYFVKEGHGYAAIASADRFQNFIDTSGEQVRILHVPTLEVDALDHPLGGSNFYWSGRIAADGLERSQPNFSTLGIVRRLDLYPHAGYLMHADGWTLAPEVAARETYYSRSQVERPTEEWLHYHGPTQVDSSLSRSDVEARLHVLAPAVERDFGGGDSGGWSARHVIQPEANYTLVSGIRHFDQTLHFDATDLASNTNEVDYGVTQRLYIRHRKTRACRVGEKPAAGVAVCTDKQQESLRWFVGQKYFFDSAFGGAIVPQYRNVLATTLDFSGTAYLDGQRDVSPVVSRLRWASTHKFDVEADQDYDTRRGKMLSSNNFVDFKQADWIAGAGVSRLFQPSEVQLGSLPKAADFLQLRWQLGYGSQAKRGLSAGTSGGYDVNATAVQFAVAQVGYNWNCCGLSGEYRRIALGTARNENQYLFNFTLAGVGTAGNLKRAERVF